MTRSLVIAAAVVHLAAIAAAQNRSPASPAERLTRDTPMTTAEGNKFIAPAEWTVTARGPATILQPPETGSASCAAT